MRKPKRSRIWLALALVWGAYQPWVPPAHGQDERSQIVAAALPTLRAGLPDGPAALDPELVCAPRLVGWRCPDALREAADASGFRLSGNAFTLICSRGQGSCRLLNVRSFVDLLEVDVEAGSRAAELTATVWEAGPGGIARSRRTRIALRREGSRWVPAE